jgi:KDO2-lipid IV(A) lauroyltransferase
MDRTGLPAHLLLLGFGRLCRALPSRSAPVLAGALAWLAGDVARLRRRVVDRQIAACYPELDRGGRARLARSVYRHLACTLVEALQGPGREPAVAVEPGWRALDEALAGGRGAIVASAHLGNFELGGRVLARRYRLLDVVKPLRNRRVDDWLQAQRHAHGIATVPVDGAAAAVLAHLRGGGLVSLLLDQDAGAAGVRIPFLGREASAWSGAARFSLQTGCPVVPMGILRQPDGAHVLHVGTALHPSGRAADEAGIRDYTAAISAEVEVIVRRDPAQWFWVHRRWKEAERAGRR